MRNNRAHDIRHCRAEITARNVCRKMKMSMIKPIYLLLRNNRLMILNQMRGIRRQSRLKVVFICVFAAIIAAAIFLLFKSGFRFLSTLGGVGLMIIDYEDNQTLPNHVRLEAQPIVSLGVEFKF